MSRQTGFWKKIAPGQSRAWRRKSGFIEKTAGERVCPAQVGNRDRQKTPCSAKNGSAFTQHVCVKGIHLLPRGKDRHVHLVAHRAGERVGDALHHAQLRAVAPKYLVMAQRKRLAVTPAGKGTEIMLARRQGGTVEGDHVRPDLVDVGAVGVVHHVG